MAGTTIAIAQARGAALDVEKSFNETCRGAAAARPSSSGGGRSIWTSPTHGGYAPNLVKKPHFMPCHVDLNTEADWGVALLFINPTGWDMVQ